MADKIKKVLRGFFNLSDSEKEEFLSIITNTKTRTYYEKRALDEEIRRLGPTNETTCPCCGK